MQERTVAPENTGREQLVTTFRSSNGRLRIIKNKTNVMAGKIDKHLKVPAALVEDQSLVPSTHNHL